MKRNAAALILTRVRDGRREVFLADRAESLRFFGGYAALPGGVRAPEDGPDDEDSADEASQATDLAPLMRCAARELFEETGLLRVAPQPARLIEAAAVRDAMLEREAKRDRSSPSPWTDFVDSDWQPEGFEPICRIKTPPFAPIRYDTEFFHTELRDGEEPRIQVGELTGGAFTTAAAALDAWNKGARLIVPPVVILLELLAAAEQRHSKDPDAAWQEFRTTARTTAQGYRDGVLHLVRFAPGVILAPLLTPTLPPATTTNCVLVGRDNLYVIDPGTPEAPEQARLFRLLDSLQSTGHRVAGVLLTHHHPDHVGGAAATAQRYGVPVHAHERTWWRLADTGHFHKSDDAKSAETRTLSDGQEFDLGTTPDGDAGWTLHASFTPGHAPGHVTFRESRYDTVMAGDMISTISTVVVSPPHGHLATYLASLQRLLREPMGTLIPGHGPAVRTGHAVIEKYLRHRARREVGLIEALGKAKTATPSSLVKSVYWDVDERLWPIAKRSLMAGLIKLEEDGKAVRDGDTWRARQI